MADGQITEVGSYNELIDNDGAFAQCLRSHQSVYNEEEDPGNQFDHYNYHNNSLIPIAAVPVC